MLFKSEPVEKQGNQICATIRYMVNSFLNYDYTVVYNNVKVDTFSLQVKLL